MSNRCLIAHLHVSVGIPLLNGIVIVSRVSASEGVRIAEMSIETTGTLALGRWNHEASHR